jgi:hypothetical protein
MPEGVTFLDIEPLSHSLWSSPCFGTQAIWENSGSQTWSFIPIISNWRGISKLSLAWRQTPCISFDPSWSST